MEQRRRTRSRRAKAEAASLVLIAGLSGAFVLAATAEGDGSADPDPDVEHRRETGNYGGFHGDVRLSLAPLIRHAVDLRRVLRQRATTGSAELSGSAQLLREWAEEFATARDLVARVLPPPGGEVIRDVTVSAAMVYRESALAGRAEVKDHKPVDSSAAARRALRLQLIGDRLFDVARRMLVSESSRRIQEVVGLPDRVPDYRLEGLDPARDREIVHQLPPAPPPAEPITSVGPEEWARSYRDDLEASAAALQQVLSEPEGEAASELDRLSSGLGGLYPKERERAEGVVLIRLALLTAAESLRTDAAGVIDVAAGSRLRLLAERLWDLGTTLLQPSLLPAGDLELFGSGGDTAPLWTGGIFRGHPPALRPGESVEKGVPGGLRLPNPAELFKP